MARLVAQYCPISGSWLDNLHQIRAFAYAVIGEKHVNAIGAGDSRLPRGHNNIVLKEISRLLSGARRNGRAGTHTPQAVIDTDYELRFKAGLQVVAK